MINGLLPLYMTVVSWSNAFLPINSMESGNSTDKRLSQPENALFEI